MRHLLIISLAAVLAVPATAQDMPGGDRAERLQKARERFEKIDTDGNREISRAEFLDAATARFEELDRNDDGVLDRDDRRDRR